MDPAFDKDQAELCVLILAVPVQMLAHRHSLLNKHVQVLGELRGKPLGFKDAQDLVPGDGADLRDALGVTEVHANLGRNQALLGELADLVRHLVG